MSLSNPLKEGTYELFIDGKSPKELVIPNEITEIKDYLFRNIRNIKTLKLHDNITRIGKFSFANCNGIEKIELNEGLLEIDDGAFANCNGIEEIELNEGLLEIGGGAFSGCSRIKSVLMPESVKKIGGGAFENIIKVNIKNLSKFCNIEFSGELGYENLYLNNVLVEDLIIPNDITKINEYAFSSCKSLKSVTFAENSKCESIGYKAFYNCTSLMSITISESVTSMGNSAFCNCPLLTRVYYGGGVEDWSDITINSDNSNLTNATRYYYSEEESTDDGNYWHYVDGVVTEWKKGGEE